MYKAIIKQWKNGKSKKAISRDLGHDIKTVRKIIKNYEDCGIENSEGVCKKSKCDDYKEEIEKYLSEDVSNLRIFELLRNQGLNISYSTLTNYTRKIKLNPDICVRFHSAAGEEAQVDFGYVGIQINASGKKSKCWIFNMRLSYSRLDYYETVFDQKVETFIQCHINAFNYFGGIPKQVKIDNLKAAVIEASFYEPVYQPLYESFSSHYNFDIIPCRVRKPQEKGKVESGIKYVKNNFFIARSFDSYEALTLSLKQWQEDYCNKRIHGTTKQKPYDLFINDEKSKLTSLPLESFNIGLSCIRKVGKDCHVVIDNNYYSVPYDYVGKEVYVELTFKLVTIYYNNEKVASHLRIKGKGRFSTNPSHYPKYKNYSPDSKEYLDKYKEEMSMIGNYAAEMFSCIVKENPKLWYGQIKGILALRTTYSDEVVNLSCKRALSFGVTKCSTIKKICEAGTYLLPLDSNEQIITLKIGVK